MRMLSWPLKEMSKGKKHYQPRIVVLCIYETMKWTKKISVERVSKTKNDMKTNGSDVENKAVVFSSR